MRVSHALYSIVNGKSGSLYEAAIAGRPLAREGSAFSACSQRHCSGGKGQTSIPLVCVDPQVADQVAPPREGLSAAGFNIEASEGTSQGGAVFVDEVEDVHASI